MTSSVATSSATYTGLWIGSRKMFVPMCMEPASAASRPSTGICCSIWNGVAR